MGGNTTIFQNSQKGAALPARWHRSILKQQADQEKKRIAMIVQIDRVLHELEKKYHWDEAYIFGSVAQKGKFKRKSDIDIAITGLNRFEHYAFTGDISELLDKRVDVVLLEECPFAKTIKKKGLRWNRKTGF